MRGVGYKETTTVQASEGRRYEAAFKLTQSGKPRCEPRPRPDARPSLRAGGCKELVERTTYGIGSYKSVELENPAARSTLVCDRHIAFRSSTLEYVA